MSRRLTAIWVEDEPEKVQSNLPVLEELGIRCRVTHVRELDEVTAGHPRYDIGIFDARLGRRQHDGIYHARSMVRAGSITSVLLVTRFLNDYVRPDRRFDPRVPFRAVPKSDMVDAAAELSEAGADAELGKTGIPDILREMEASPFSSSSPLPPAPVIDVPEGTFGQVSDFYARPLEFQLDLLDRVHDAYRGYIDNIFDQTPDAAWIVLGAPTGEFLRWGDAHEDRPSNLQSMVQLAGDAVGPACVPFTFSRPTYRIF